MIEHFGRHREHCGRDREQHGFRRPGFGVEGEGGRFGGRHWRGGRGMGRPFDPGDLRLVMLVLIADKPRHGYEIIKEIEERFGGSYAPSPGVVYPTLTMLEEIGHATVAEAGGKKLYTITDLGTAYLAEHRAAADLAMGRMGQAAASYGGGPAPQLIRAIENLKLALRLRQQSGPLTEDQLRVIVAALDTATVTIERS